MPKKKNQLLPSEHSVDLSATEQDGKRQEATELPDAKQRMESVLAASEVGTWTYEIAPNRVVADANLSRMFGVSPEEAAGGALAAYLRAIHPEDRPRVEKTIAEAIAERLTFTSEYRLVQRDGACRTVLARGKVERDDAGRALRLPGVVLDITDRVKAEQERSALADELRRRERTIETLLSSIADFAYIFDKEGCFVYANKPLLDLWGLSLQEAVGKNFFDLRYETETAAKLQRQIREVFETKQPLADRTPYTSPSGVSGYYEYIFRPVFAPDGSVELVAGSTREMSEQQRLIQDRENLLASERAARSTAEHASRMKDEFLATLSHELRSPLNAIFGWTQVLRECPDDAETVVEGLDVIDRNVRAQTQLIEDLLDMSRIISGKLRLDVQRVNLSQCIDAAIETTTPAAEAKEIRVEKILDPAAGPVSGDPGRIQQILWNLLSNAVKFTSRGGKVQVLLERVNSHLEISVADTGQGISAEFLPHVFDRFRQADGAANRKHGGLGLGLAIVKQLVELHGGTIRVASGGLGKGTTFTIHLPLKVLHTHTDDDERLHPKTPASTPAFRKNATLSGLKVLAVDDERDSRELLKRVLQDSGAIVITAASVSDALALLASEKPDVLVSDIGMPEVDGYEFLKKVRALESIHGGKIPAVALTAFARSEDRTRALLAGFLSHVSKPVEPSELVATIAAVSGRTGATGE